MKLPIELHTREGLMQLWSGVQYYPKQLQLRLKREIDRRNRLRSLGKPFKLMLLLLLYINISYSQVVVNTNSVYEFEIFTMQETNDCSVRAISSIGYDYYEAHKLLKESGREDCKPISLRTFIKALVKTKRFVGIYRLNRISNSKTFISDIAKDNIYIVFNQIHTWVIKDNKVYGNPSDKYSPIVGFIEIDYNKKKSNR